MGKTLRQEDGRWCKSPFQLDNMPESPESFDPYREWLEIPPEDQPPSYYRLLGVQEFEADLAVIDAAAKQRTAYLHPMASGPNRESVQGLLSEVAKARRTLLAADSKSAYDESLHSAATPTFVSEVGPPPLPSDLPPVDDHDGEAEESSTGPRNETQEIAV